MNSTKQHVKLKHGQSYNAKTYQQKKLAASTMAVLDMVGKCFGNGDDKETQASKLSSVQRLLERRRRLIDILENHRRHMRCKFCGKETKLKFRKSFYDWRVPMDHARIHMGKPMFRCKLCGHDAHSYTAIRQHTNRKRRLSIQGQYEDNSDQFHHEVMKMISKCYGHA